MNAKQNIQAQKTKKNSTQKVEMKKEKGIFKSEQFPFNKQNYILIAIGFGITILGYILMVGDENIYSFGNNTLPVILVMLGFAVIVYAILKRPKQAKHDDSV